MDIKILKIPESGFAANSYIIFSDGSKKGVLIDPGSPAKTIEANIKEYGIDIEKIILTHGHVDHINSVEEMRNLLKVPVLIHEADEAMIEDPVLNFSSQMGPGQLSFKADELLQDGDIIKVEEGFELEVIHTPGHTEGGICLKFGDFLVTGDTLFEGSIGRTDFPGGNYKDIIESIKGKLLVLDEEIVILPGHGNHSTLGNEKNFNPFLR